MYKSFVVDLQKLQFLSEKLRDKRVEKGVFVTTDFKPRFALDSEGVPTSICAEEVSGCVEMTPFS